MTKTKKNNTTSTVTMYATSEMKLVHDDMGYVAWYKDTASALKGANDGDTLYAVTFEKVADIKLQLVATKKE